MLSTREDGIGFEWAKDLAEIGYDYVELPLAQVMALSEAAFQKLKEQMDSFGIKCRACNNFFPASVRLTGWDADQSVISDYVFAAVSRASEMGVETIVFGSSGAKNVPEGFSMRSAWGQLTALLQYIDTIVLPAGIVIAIEPLNRRESNIINTLSEGQKLVEKTDRSNIRLLADYYHMMLEGDGILSVAKAAGCLAHLHIANPEGRLFPKEGDEAGYSEFIKKILDTGYTGRLSVEAYSTDVIHDASEALGYLKGEIQKYG